MSFYEHQRRNRRYTALLVGSFVLLFGALGLGLDASVAGFGFGGARIALLRGMATT